MLVFVIVVLVVNFLLWLILLLRFYKIFNTDKIMEKTEKKVLRLTNEIDTAGNRSLYLINESSKEIKKTIADADLEIQRFQEATNRLREMIAKVELLHMDKSFDTSTSPIYGDIPETKRTYEKKNSSYNRQNASESYKKQSESTKKLPESIDPDAIFEIRSGTTQDDLFEEENRALQEAQKSILSDQITVTSDGAAYKEVPLIITKVLDESPVSRKKEVEENIGITNTFGAEAAKKKFTKNVIELYNEGFTIEQIAQQMGSSVTEVQMVIYMEIDS